ncbi:MAG TPA: AAA family ATPase [Candidatus Angelobacter sp.]
MIKIQSLTIKEFRGIRDLILEPDRKNFAIYGPNGSGKSGVVDAIEFVLTGSISRLMGSGTAGLSVKKHAPHVDQRNAPDFAQVILKAYAPSINKEFTIERRVSNPDAVVITPDNDPQIKGVVEELKRHPELALTRREIIKYVLAAPGERAKQVQALLRLDQIETIRINLKKIQNTAKADSIRKEQEATSAQTQLLRALGLPALKKDDVLKAVNARRGLVGLPDLAELDTNTSIKAGLGTSTPAPKSKVPKKQAASDLSSLTGKITKAESSTVTAKRNAVTQIIEKLLGSPSLLQSLQREAFLRTGLDLIQEESCPLCDTEWDLQELKQLVNKKLAEAKQASALRNQLTSDSQPLALELRDLETLANTVSNYAKQLSSSTTAIDTWSTELKSRRKKLTALDHLPKTLENIKAELRVAPDAVAKELEALQPLIDAIPDPSQEDAAKEYLTICQERLDAFREATRQSERCKSQFDIATKVMDAFNGAANTVLENIYKEVEADFSKYYQQINDDESAFTGKLEPSQGSLDFNVQFYGRGFFPPGAYHSEGHQDSMGICLYLALMRHTLGKGFTFVVLDDVLMSVDSGHRREVCAMLKSQFPDTQFIITTHDEVWLKHMRTEGLISGKSAVEFQKWTVETGPIVWNDLEVWDEIKTNLDAGKVKDAATVLRRYLEYISGQLADKLRAKVEFRGDLRHDLSDLFDAVVGEWRRLLNDGIQAARSWSNKTEEIKISEMLKEFSAKIKESEGERWTINVGVHYNDWANFSKEDFAPVVEAYKKLLETMRCPTCQTFLHVTPVKGHKENLRCNCGATSINLSKKK